MINPTPSWTRPAGVIFLATRDAKLASRNIFLLGSVPVINVECMCIGVALDLGMVSCNFLFVRDVLYTYSPKMSCHLWVEPLLLEFLHFSSLSLKLVRGGMKGRKNQLLSLTLRHCYVSPCISLSF